MKPLTEADRTIAALRVACTAAADRYAAHHLQRHAYRTRQAARYERLAEAYKQGEGSPCHGPRAMALRLASAWRGLAYEALAKGDAHEAHEAWQIMRAHLRRGGLTAAVWCPRAKR